MRILILVEGGAVQGVKIEQDGGRPRVILHDADNINAGDAFLSDDLFDAEFITTRSMDRTLKKLQRGDQGKILHRKFLKILEAQ